MENMIFLSAFERRLAVDLFPNKTERDAYVELAKMKASGELARLTEEVRRQAEPGTLPTLLG